MVPRDRRLTPYRDVPCLECAEGVFIMLGCEPPDVDSLHREPFISNCVRTSNWWWCQKERVLDVPGRYRFRIER